MGRGRTGLTDQSLLKPKRTDGTVHRGTQIVYVKNREAKKMTVPDHVVDFMKNMNPQQLVDFLLSSD